MLSSRQQQSSLNSSYSHVESHDHDSDNDQQNLTGAVAVQVNTEGQRRRNITNQDNRIPVSRDGGYSSSINSSPYSSSSSSSHKQGALDRIFHGCCCKTFCTPPTRSLHMAFLKSLAITVGALVLVFLLGVVFEPLVMESDGWMDCADPECSVVVSRSGWFGSEATRSSHVVPVSDSLLVSAYHRTDMSEAHAIQNPQFFNEWHDRTVLDFLDQQKKEADALAKAAAELTKAGDADQKPLLSVTRQLYQQGDGSIHSDASRSREIFDGEKSQLEKAYLDLVPWLPHHMRLGGMNAVAPTVKSKTTAPLLTRDMLDETTDFLTNTYPGCMWLRLWIVDSTMYIHSFNTKKVVRSRIHPETGVRIDSNPTNVFGYESSRLNHFLMMLLHVITQSLSVHLGPDTRFHDLPPQPEAAAGIEDSFPNIDAVFMIGDTPCSNMTKVVEQYEDYRANLIELTRARLDAMKSSPDTAAHAALIEESARIMQQFPSFIDLADEIQTKQFLHKLSSPAATATTTTTQSTETPASSTPTEFLQLESIPLPPALKPLPSSSSSSASEAPISTVYNSIQTFQNSDELTRNLVLLPRTIDTELTRRERLLADMRRGIYPKPPKVFSPLFTIRQPAAQILPPPPGMGDHTQAYSLYDHLFANHQIMLQSPNLLLPDFTRWAQLNNIEEENQSASAALTTPDSITNEDGTTTTPMIVKEEGGLEEDAAILAGSHGSSADTPDASSSSSSSQSTSSSKNGPSIHALKLHQLHNKQIAHLRNTQKIMLVLSPLSPGTSKKQIQDQEDEFEIEGLSSINVKDMHSMEVPPPGGKLGQNEPGAVHNKPLSLQQRMLRKLHILLKHRLIHAHDYSTQQGWNQQQQNGTKSWNEKERDAELHKAKIDGEGILQDLMSLLNNHYADYSPLEEQRSFEEKFGTGFKIYNAESVVPSTCHLPLVVYEETPVNAKPDGTIESAYGGNIEAGSGNTIKPLPGSWAHWLWTCDYLVLREVHPVARLPVVNPAATKADDEKAAADKKKKSKRAVPSKIELPPLILPASNTFDEYWSVTYEPYKHYIPFVLTLTDESEMKIEASNEEATAGDRLKASVSALATAKDTKTAVAHSHDHTVLTQLRASYRTRLLQASVPGAFNSHAQILHLLPLLHQLFATDWTNTLAPHASHRHEVLNADSHKKNLHEEGTEHEEAMREKLGMKPLISLDSSSSSSSSSSDGPNTHGEDEASIKSFEERHSCSSHFTTLSDSLSCLWCVRTSSRHWMRTVMTPEYIGSYTKKLFTLYGHSLQNPPSADDVQKQYKDNKRFQKIKTQTDVREWIKSVVFSTQGMED